VAWREASEETGITGLVVAWPAVHLDVHEVAPPGEPAHLHLDVRHLVLAPPGARAVGNHESEALRWVEVGELPDLGADAGLLALARAAMAALDRYVPPGAGPEVRTGRRA
jgi:8-oxo-dGTP pyrophosphatase MutT (NUDIX family)